LNFPPLRTIPIYLAARGPRILELAGEIADGVIIGGFALRSGLDFARTCVQTGLDLSGRSWSELEVVSWLYTSVDDDPETAREAVKWLVFTSLITSRPILDQIGIVIPTALRDHLDRTGWSLTPESIAVGKTLLNAEILNAFSVTGTPSQCARKLREVAQLGVDQIAMVPLCPRGVTFETMARRIATEVLPLVTRGTAI
jgi:5,10-methylenetetrahydromethanopterin reductase